MLNIYEEGTRNGGIRVSSAKMLLIGFPHSYTTDDTKEIRAEKKRYVDIKAHDLCLSCEIRKCLRKFSYPDVRVAYPCMCY